MKLADGYELDPAVPLGDLRPHPKNPNQGDVGAIVESIETVGFYGVVIAQKPNGKRQNGRILAGEHRWRAAKEEGADTIPVCWVDVDDTDADRILLGDNLIARLALMDQATQSAMLQALTSSDAGLSGTGYDNDDLDNLLNDLANQPGFPTPDVPEPDEPPPDPVSAHGDVWLLGPHRIMCGDSRDPDDVATLLAGATINVAFTSPPYADRRKYDETTTFRPIPPDEYVEWFAPVAANVAAHLADDGSWFVNIKAGADGLDTELYVLDLVLAHAREWGWHYATEFCWERNGMPKSVTRRFKNQFEPIYQFARGEWKMRADNVRHASDDALVPFGPGRGNTSWADPDSAVVSQGQRGDAFAGQRLRKRAKPNRAGPNEAQGSGVYDVGWAKTSGLAYPGNRLPILAGTHEATGHTAAFPVGLPAFFVQAYTDEGDTIYDPFMGSGSTLLAAHQHDRIGYGMELSPGYCDVILARWQRHTEIAPVLESTGESRDFG